MQRVRFRVRDAGARVLTQIMARHSWFAGLLIGIISFTGCTTTPDRGVDPTAPIVLPSPPGAEGSITGTSQTGAGGTPEVVTAELGDVVWTTVVDPAGLPATPVAVFTPDAPMIYAALPVIRIAAGTTISAVWTYNDTSLDALASSVNASETRAGGWIEFHLNRTGPEPWPDGTYGITVSANGQVIQTGEIRIENT